jgi:hypothetical protein
MSHLRFNHQQRKRKTWLLPLIVIILLYVSIPFLLIQRGEESLEKAISQTENKMVEIPSKEYGSGIVFLEIAEVFPGFTTWAKQIRNRSNEKMQEIYNVKCRNKSTELFKLYSDTIQYDSLSVHFEHTGELFYLNAVVFTNQKKENMKILLPDEPKNELENDFCDIWKEFFQKHDINVPKNNSICQ